jgi:hypothetical protein
MHRTETLVNKTTVISGYKIVSITEVVICSEIESSRSKNLGNLLSF